MSKQALPASAIELCRAVDKQLQQLLQERIQAIPELAGQTTDIDIGGVVWAPGGTGGNWTVPVLRGRDAYHADIARIMRTAGRI